MNDDPGAQQAPAPERHAVIRPGAAPATVQATLGRVWLVTHVAALAGVAAALWEGTAPALLGAWSGFVLLTVVLEQWSKAGPRAGGQASLEVGLAAVLGLAWGSGLALFVPGADGMALATLLSAALGVALVAIPVLGERPQAYVCFLAALGLLATGGVLHDGRHPGIVPWIALTMATLALVAGVYFRRHEALASVVRRLLAVTGEHAQSAPLSLAGAERALDELDQRLARDARQYRLLHHLGDALLGTDAAGRVDYVNPFAEQLLGATAAELVGKPLGDCLRIVYGREPHNRTEAILAEARLTLTSQRMHDQAQLIRQDGVAFGVDYSFTPLTDADGSFVGVSVLLRDVTARRQRVESIAWRATHDTLTGCINRAEFERRLGKLLRQAGDTPRKTHTLLYIDIDKFKFINDTYGHAAGDHALRSLVDVMRARIRGADTLARIGGDEFCALLYSCDAERARGIGESVRAGVESHDFTWQSIELPVSISVGVVEIGPEVRDTAHLLRAADAACYSAKHFGRNRVQLFEATAPEEDSQARELRRVGEIQSALHAGRLDLFYQPLCATMPSLPSDRCELTAGVRTSDDQPIPRPEMLDLAARYQLGSDIDRWLIGAAVEALVSDHPALSDMCLALVPLGASSVADERLLEYAIRRVREHPRIAPRLGFSLPEASLASHADVVRYFVTTLKQDGCQFLVGDLGFGGGAIDVLKTLQVDYLGIRGSFVANLLSSSVDYEVVLGLSRVARALGLKTVAEHADSRSVREALAKMGIEFAKGQLFDGPRRVTRFDESLLGQREPRPSVRPVGSVAPARSAPGNGVAGGTDRTTG
ncbi:MAG: diguanylate cyclase [Gammaproteobacteria bacterium]|nr:diguanylate cyclase [Gammaproteobacteria bacterium]